MTRLRRLAAVQHMGTDPAMADLLKVYVDHAGCGVCVIKVAGEIDMATAPALDATVSQQCARLPSVLVLELRGVRFLGSSGLASLMAAREATMAIGARLRLVCVGPHVLRPMDLTGLTELFEVYPDPESALRGRLS